jgi:ABC-2 type transport system ATP-binding protein
MAGPSPVFTDGPADAPPARSVSLGRNEHTGLAIQAEAISKSFGRRVALDGVTLSVRSGEVYGYLGPNGAGKTTTIRILLGLIHPDAGDVRVFGRVIGRHWDVKDPVGALVERPAMYPYLTARENLSVFGSAMGLDRNELSPAVADALSRVGLSSETARASQFSTGMLQRLGLAYALLNRPTLVFLDEPTNGLDPEGIIEVRELVRSLRRDGVTVFLSSHDLSEVEQVCDRVAILRAGKIVSEVDVEELGTGAERIDVRLGSFEAAQQARAILEASFFVEAPSIANESAITLHATAAEGARVAELLGEAGLYASEMTVRRPTLEAVYLAAMTEAAGRGPAVDS